MATLGRTVTFTTRIRYSIIIEDLTAYSRSNVKCKQTVHPAHNVIISSREHDESFVWTSSLFDFYRFSLNYSPVYLFRLIVKYSKTMGVWCRCALVYQACIYLFTSLQLPFSTILIKIFCLATLTWLPNFAKLVDYKKSIHGLLRNFQQIRAHPPSS